MSGRSDGSERCKTEMGVEAEVNGQGELEDDDEEDLGVRKVVKSPCTRQISQRVS